MDYLCLQKWEDEYNGAGIYGIKDKTGRYYIGQAKHIQKRLHQHRQFLNMAARGREPASTENPHLLEIARNGGKLWAEILHKIPWNEATDNNLRYYELYYYNKYGGFEKTYNVAPVNAPLRHIESMNNITIKIDAEADIIPFLDGIENVEEYIKELVRKDIKNNL